MRPMPQRYGCQAYKVFHGSATAAYLQSIQARISEPERAPQPEFVNCSLRHWEIRNE
jgi:hypothetical protein